MLNSLNLKNLVFNCFLMNRKEIAANSEVLAYQKTSRKFSGKDVPITRGFSEAFVKLFVTPFGGGEEFKSVVFFGKSHLLA